MKTKIAILLLLTTTIFSCGKLRLYTQDKGELIASVGNKKLYNSDLKHFITEGMTSHDSIALVDAYIENWIKNEVKIAAAETALSDEEATIEELVNKYRESLISYRYENMVVNEQLDTTVTKKQIEEYYNENRDNFRLAGPVVKAAVARLPKQLRIGRKIEDLFKKTSDSSSMEFRLICQKNNYKYEDFSNEWTDFGTVITHIPFTKSNFDEFLKTNKYYETEDGDYKYLMKITSYRPTGDYSPLELQTGNIRKILINSRRAELIRNLEDSLVQVARNKKLIQINKK